CSARLTRTTSDDGLSGALPWSVNWSFGTATAVTSDPTSDTLDKGMYECEPSGSPVARRNLSGSPLVNASAHEATTPGSTSGSCASTAPGQGVEAVRFSAAGTRGI